MSTTGYITAALVALMLGGCAAGVKTPAHPAPTVQATPAPARALAAPVLARASR
jgi:hypothetical protein